MNLDKFLMNGIMGDFFKGFFGLRARLATHSGPTSTNSMALAMGGSGPDPVGHI